MVRRRRLVLFIIELAILAVLIVVLVYYQSLTGSIEVQDVDESKITVNDISEETLVEFEGYETIAVFGLDNRDTGSYDYGNTDMIMIFNINNDTKEISMVSVYRDTYLNIAPAGQTANYEKCNSAYNYGGASQAINMLNQNLDLVIDHYMSVDFEAVSECIDILGGVDIEIESEYELEYLNDYIIATNEILGTYSPTVDSVGWHTLDGTQAVAYSRIRYTSGGDYKRTQRQRIVLSEMLSKAKDANVSQLMSMVDALFDDIATDMSQSELLSTAQALLNCDLSESQGFPFERAATVLEGVYAGDIVVPCDLTTNVSQLHEFLFGDVDYVPSAQVQAYSAYIVERTGLGAGDGYDDEFAYSDQYDDEEPYEFTEDDPNPFAVEEEVVEEVPATEENVDTGALYN